MTYADAVKKQLAQVTRARTESAIFVRMEGRLAVVNIGTSTVAIPCVGFNPPLPGMPVRVDWVNGSPSVTGPTRPLNPLGVITSAGSPRATVAVDGVQYLMPVIAGYTAAVNDEVIINWNIPGGQITGKLAAVDEPDSPGENGGTSREPFTVTVRATNSGRFQSGSGWWGRGPWASSSNQGIWTYGSRVRDAVGSGTATSASIYLPLISEVGNAAIGVHPHAGIPGGAPSILFGVNLPAGRRGGWWPLDPSFAPYLAAGGRGVGVYAPGGGGYTRWRGVDEDGLSGALRISGTR